MSAEFTPTRVAELTALSASARAAGPLQPISTPIVIDGQGYAWLPDPDPLRLGDAVGCYVHAGIRLGWAPMTFPPPGGALLTLFGGQRADGFDSDGVAAFITRDGLNSLIADLQAIAASIAPPATDDQKGEG
ncbi:hypothetical protein [Sphingomonas sp.]|jgi:hypothetical protein|uniref:hypothetical protein n=1 Tax=Sphingomonas sp. TaxID=28214 RepID=UPI0026305F59|nr:hypothetical protein [Sphingomonas sp.]MDF2603481.1 hypothetical protein [Sphingomonas sp.]